jgi:hypothetical protein
VCVERESEHRQLHEKVLRGQTGNLQLILDGRVLGFAAKLQGDFLDWSRLGQVEDDLPSEKSGSHFGSGAFEGNDISVHDEFNASMFFIPRALKDVV